MPTKQEGFPFSTGEGNLPNEASKSATGNYIGQRLKEIKEKQARGEELSGSDKVVLGKTQTKPDALDLGNESSLGEEETVVKRGEKTKKGKEELKTESEDKKTPEKKEKTPVAVLKDLLGEKKRIEQELSKNFTEAGRQEKKRISWEIATQACAVLGKNFDKEKLNIESSKEAEWQASLAASGFKNEENYKNRFRAPFTSKELQDEYDSMIKNNGNLSEKQKQDLLNPEDREIKVGGLRGIMVSQRDVAICAHFGFDITQLKFKAFGLSNKLVMPWRGGIKTFDDLTELNTFITQKQNIFIDEKRRNIEKETEEKMNARKNEIIDKEIEQVLLDRKIKELTKDIREKQLKEIETERQKKLEEAGGPEKLIKDISDKWAEIGKTAKRKGKKQNPELQSKINKLSKRVVKDIWVLTGIDLIKKAKSEVPEESFNKYIMSKIMDIYKEQRAKLAAEKKNKKPGAAKLPEKKVDFDLTLVDEDEDDDFISMDPDIEDDEEDLS